MFWCKQASANRLLTSGVGTGIFFVTESFLEFYAHNTWESCATRNWHSTPSFV